MRVVWKLWKCRVMLETNWFTSLTLLMARVFLLLHVVRQSAGVLASVVHMQCQNQRGGECWVWFWKGGWCGRMVLMFSC